MTHAAPYGPVSVVRTGQARLLPSVQDLRKMTLSVDPTHVSTLEELDVCSSVCTPLIAPDGVLGALTVVRGSHRAAFTASDAAVVRALGMVAGTALRHGQLYQEAHAASQAKDAFIATLGHELRNPIAAITNAVAVLERLGAPGDEAVGVRTIIMRQARHLARLVDDLLDVSRLTSGKLTLKRQPVHLKDVAERSLATLRMSDHLADHEVAIQAESATVAGDPTRLEQILDNLLDNAVKYTPPGGRIAVSVRRDGPVAELRVQDTGTGIAPELLPHVFDRFAQGPQSPDRGQGGLGLGLTLVRQLAELLGGTVHAASSGPGGGTTMTVRLPLATAVESEADAGASGGAPAVRRRRILLVEDNADGREALQRLLQLDGHDVEVAGDGARGIELARGGRFDIALVDIGLPGMTGYDVARALRHAANGQAMRLVALTGYGQPADRIRAQEAGFDAHLVKPVDLDQLARALDPDAADDPIHRPVHGPVHRIDGPHALP